MASAAATRSLQTRLCLLQLLIGLLIAARADTLTTDCVIEAASQMGAAR